MLSRYEDRFTDSLSYFDIVLHAKVVQAIQILDIELLNGRKGRLLQRLENHRFSADEAGDIHDLHKVSPVI